MALWGNTDADASIPKYLNAADNAKCYFIDTTEASVEANQDKGLGTAGWNLYETYTAEDGSVRHKAETLVAMAVTAADAGDLGTTGDTADEDLIVADE